MAVPPATPTALRYYTSGNWLFVFDQVVWIALLAAILFSGVSARLRTWAQRIGRNWFFTMVVYFALFTIVTSVITLPLAYYEEFVRQHDYGLSNQTLQKWWTDSLTALAVSCVAGGLFLWVPYLLLRKSPRRWWLHTAAAAIPFIVVGNLVAPDLDRAALQPIRTDAGQGAGGADPRAGGSCGHRWQPRVRGQQERRHENAECVCRRPLADQADRPVGHDHRAHGRSRAAVRHGSRNGTLRARTRLAAVAAATLLILLLLYAAYKTMGAIVERWGHRFGFSDLAEVASLPLLLLVTNLFSLVIVPAQLALTRYQEHEADRFGLEITQTNHSAGTAFVKLQEDALGNPWPGSLFKLWRASHPPLGERIEFSNEYHPWREGAPLRYADRVQELRRVER